MSEWQGTEVQTQGFGLINTLGPLNWIIEQAACYMPRTQTAEIGALGVRNTIN